MGIHCIIDKGYTGEMWEVSVHDSAGVAQTLYVNYTCRLVVQGTDIDRSVIDKNPGNTAFQVQLSPTDTAKLSAGFATVGIIIENATITPQPLKDITLIKLEVVEPFV